MNYTIEEIYQNIEVSERRFIIHPDTGFSLPATITATNCTFTYNNETGEVIITEATGDVVVTANMVGDTFNIAYNLTNVSGVGTLPTTVTYGSQITITFEADSGYRMPSTVNVSGCSYSWQQSSGQYWELSLLEFTGNVTISIEGIRAYTITKTATHALIQGADTIDAGGYSLYNIVPDNGYYLPDTMFVNGFTVGSTTVDLGNSKARYEKQDDEWAILYLSDVNENITCSIGAIAYYTITTTITNATLNSVYIGGVLATPPYKIKHGRSVMLNLTANTGYEWVSGNYSCTMSGSSAGQFTVNGSSLQCYIQTVTGNITLTATATSTVHSYTLANTLSNISVDGVEVNDVSVGSIPSTVLSSDVVEMVFTCASGYEIPSSITVNGVTVGVGLGDVSANGCTANYMAFQSATNRCFIVLKNFTANTSFTVTAQSSGVITDLTGTKWEITSTTCTAGYGNFAVGGMAVDGEPYGSTAASLLIGYRFRMWEVEEHANSVLIMGQIIEVTVGTIIEFTDSGTDSTNVNLISWIKSHATQMPNAIEIINPITPLPDPIDEDAST